MQPLMKVGSFQQKNPSPNIFYDFIIIDFKIIIIIKL